ncbi:glycerol-3-phosphate responsive antiterminator [Mesobacillus foraminis]|jgi:glycerol uptake operon antiterminator|uniref:Glycerol uptake operon antiterminator regulatory protein n=1 Tax=Mesobacillus foraminis TaxID=279826 RepID=A0A4R2BHW7_9BACI|nr:glycerol-3-phosphate responsive antiterminator [Mesobacillus foraminis]TCN26641.1 glycerol uptake operon antiterminator [Mesobacillus foraminis]
MDQKILPASSSMKEFEAFLKSPYKIGVFLEMHIAQLKNVHLMAEAHGKKMLYHVDLIHGIKSDDYATEFICQEYKPHGLISTKSSVILKAKQKGVLAVQRVFLIDSHALEKSFKLLEKTKPDYIEVLPGAMPGLIHEVKQKVNIPLFAGGFIRTPQEVQNALDAGADAVTTSKRQLWQHFL